MLLALKVLNIRRNFEVYALYVRELERILFRVGVVGGVDRLLSNELLQ